MRWNRCYRIYHKCIAKFSFITVRLFNKLCGIYSMSDPIRYIFMEFKNIHTAILNEFRSIYSLNKFREHLFNAFIQKKFREFIRSKYISAALFNSMQWLSLLLNLALANIFLSRFLSYFYIWLSCCLPFIESKVVLCIFLNIDCVIIIFNSNNFSQEKKKRFFLALFLKTDERCQRATNNTNNALCIA
jgi:hypothetical protein